jgi:protein-tyrosine phosphatase
MGHVIFQRMVDDAGLADRVRVSSSGTGDWHVGEHADPRTVAELARHAYDGSRHRAREFDPAEFDEIDLVLASDEGHVRTLQRLAGTPDDRRKIRLVREFDPEAVAAGTLETGDPWYGGDDHFARCFTEVEAACHGILQHVRDQLDRRLAGRLDTERP